MPRNSDLALLHPECRQRVEQLGHTLKGERIPFRLFEGFRSPQRQRELYAQGRTMPGGIVTRSKPWRSYHQYGLATDFVLYIDGKWSWDDTGKRKAWWERLHELARSVGLEPLSWELPHVQVSGIRMESLRSGNYPAGGDDSWASNLKAAIESWSGSPPSPGRTGLLPSRPPLVDVPIEDQPDDATRLVATYRVIARGGLRLRSGPGIEYDVIGNISTGQLVSLLGSKGDWGMVDIQGDGLADGFCHRGFLATHQSA